MTLNLNGLEMETLERLAERKGLTKTALLRQALRLYQSIEERLDSGQKMLLEHPETKEKTELVVI
jgi:trehalose-6-phosphate synthase